MHTDMRSDCLQRRSNPIHSLLLRTLINVSLAVPLVYLSQAVQPLPQMIDDRPHNKWTLRLSNNRDLRQFDVTVVDRRSIRRVAEWSATAWRNVAYRNAVGPVVPKIFRSGFMLRRAIRKRQRAQFSTSQTRANFHHRLRATRLGSQRHGFPSRNAQIPNGEVRE